MVIGQPNLRVPSEATFFATGGGPTGRLRSGFEDEPEPVLCGIVYRPVVQTDVVLGGTYGGTYVPGQKLGDMLVLGKQARRLAAWVGGSKSMGMGWEADVAFGCASRASTAEVHGGLRLQQRRRGVGARLLFRACCAPAACSRGSLRYVLLQYTCQSVLSRTVRALYNALNVPHHAA